MASQSERAYWSSLAPLPSYTKEERGAQARGLMRLFEKWRLTGPEQSRLLGLQDNTRSSLNRYRKGSPLDNTPDMLERAANLLAIHHNLVRLYPENTDLVFNWVTTPDTRLDGLAPIQVMANEGLTGIKRIRYFLDDMVSR